MGKIMGLFESYEGADRAAEALEFAGLPERISVVSRDEGGRERAERVEWRDRVNNNVIGAVTVGAAGGMVVGGLVGFIIGVTATLIWGSGPDLAAWALSTALGAAAAGVGIGMVTGSVVGALVGLGFLGVYTQGVRRGGVLVTTRTPDSHAADSARDIMLDSGAVDINEWTNEPSAASPWTGFRENIWPEGYVPSTLMHTHSHS